MAADINDRNPIGCRDTGVNSGAAAYLLRIDESVYNNAGYQYRRASLDNFIEGFFHYFPTLERFHMPHRAKIVNDKVV